MSRLEGIKNHLRPGKVYRRQELGKWSKSIDRDLDALLKDGSLKKLSQGLYYHPKQSAFGPTPLFGLKFKCSHTPAIRSQRSLPNLKSGTPHGYVQRSNHQHSVPRSIQITL